jgi:hypothetical protein
MMPTLISPISRGSDGNSVAIVEWVSLIAATVVTPATMPVTAPVRETHPADEEVGLRIEPVVLGVAPDWRQHEVSEHLGQCSAAENVVSWGAFAVGELADAKECERRLGFTGHE